MPSYVIFGATSVIAHETAKALAASGAAFFLVGRNSQKLAAVRDDLLARGAERAEICVADPADCLRHTEIIGAALRALKSWDAVLIAHGCFVDQHAGERDVQVLLEAFRVNTLSVLSLAGLAANQLQLQRQGCLAVIASVAGDRGRRANYIYGSTKAAVDIFLQGLRCRFSGTKIRILTIKPGLVKTPQLPAARMCHPLAAHPRSVGRAIARAMSSRNEVMYVPRYWRPIMAVIRMLPDFVFQRLNF